MSKPQSIPLRELKPDRWSNVFLLVVVSAMLGCSRPNEPLKWSDRRPIGVIFLARDNTNWADNPRGWFGDASLNIHTETGKESFRIRLTQTAKNIIQLAATVHAQGVIVWDIEGEQYPHPDGSFVGDPRLLDRLAPEMDELADGFFTQLSAAGLKTGVLIRPQRAKWENGRLDQEEFIFNNDGIVAELAAKIAYVRQRWGCSLFYVDSNFSLWHLGVYNSDIFRRLHRRYPDILLIPEYENADYFDCSSPYFDPTKREKFPGTIISAAQVRAFQPQAFSSIYIGNIDPSQGRKSLADAVAKGDILLYRGWWRGPEFGLVGALTSDERGGSCH
jgi:hypothetical protein